MYIRACPRVDLAGCPRFNPRASSLGTIIRPHLPPTVLRPMATARYREGTITDTLLRSLLFGALLHYATALLCRHPLHIHCSLRRSSFGALSTYIHHTLWRPSAPLPRCPLMALMLAQDPSGQCGSCVTRRDPARQCRTRLYRVLVGRLPCHGTLAPAGCADGRERITPSPPPRSR